MIMVDIDLCAPHAYIGPQHGNGASSREVGDGHVQTHSEREREKERGRDGDEDEAACERWPRPVQLIRTHPRRALEWTTSIPIWLRRKP